MASDGDDIEVEASEAKKSLLPRCHVNLMPTLGCPEILPTPSSPEDVDCKHVRKAWKEPRLLFLRLPDRPGRRLRGGRLLLLLLLPRAEISGDPRDGPRRI